MAGFTTQTDDIYGSPPSEFFRGRVFRVRQIHSSRVITVSDETPEAIGRVEADALVTDKKNSLLTVWVADCVPVILAQEQGLCIAAAHAGWRGLAGGVIGAALAALKVNYDASPSSILASVGPAIGSCCYEVGSDVAEKIAASCGDESVITIRKGRMFADLQHTAKLQLLAAGVQHSKIEVLSDCTRCSDELFFSRRRGNITERQCGFVGIFEPGHVTTNDKNRGPTI